MLEKEVGHSALHRTAGESWQGEVEPLPYYVPIYFSSLGAAY